MMHIEAFHGVDFLAGIKHRQRQRRGTKHSQPFIGEHAAGHGAQWIQQRGKISLFQTDGCKMASRG